MNLLNDLFKAYNLDLGKFRFIECSTVSDSEDSVHPSDLTDLSLRMSEAIRDLDKPSFVFFDTINALTVYNKKNNVVEFIDAISKKSKMDDFGIVWLHVRSSTDILDAVTKTFVDDVVDYMYTG